MIQSLLKWGEFWEYLPIFFRDVGCFSKYIKGFGIPGPPFQGSTNVFNVGNSWDSWSVRSITMPLIGLFSDVS